MASSSLKSIPAGWTPSTYQYLKNSIRSDAALDAVRTRTDALGSIARMQIAPDQGQFLRFLVGSLNVKKVVEVGTFTGYSSTAMAQGMPEGAKLFALDVSEEWTAIAKETWSEAGVSDKIELRIGQANESLRQLLSEHGAGSFDFGFIDADKASYDTYYESILELLRPGGLIAIDNVLWSGKVADPEATDDDTVALKLLNEKIKADDRVDMCMLCIADGLTLVRKL